MGRRRKHRTKVVYKPPLIPWNLLPSCWCCGAENGRKWEVGEHCYVCRCDEHPDSCGPTCRYEVRNEKEARTGTKEDALLQGITNVHGEATRGSEPVQVAQSTLRGRLRRGSIPYARLSDAME